MLGASALAWTALVVAMTQAGFSGNPRYLSLALVVVCVLAGAGSVELIRSARQPVLAVAVAAVIVAVGAPIVRDRLDEQAVGARELATMHSQLITAVDRMGGAAHLRALGPTTANRAFQSHLAWELGVPMDRVERPPGPVTVLRAGAARRATRAAAVVADGAPAPARAGWQLESAGRRRTCAVRDIPTRGRTNRHVTPQDGARAVNGLRGKWAGR